MFRTALLAASTCFGILVSVAAADEGPPPPDLSGQPPALLDTPSGPPAAPARLHRAWTGLRLADDAGPAAGPPTAHLGRKHVRRRLLRRFDADGDGRLDRTERRAARRAFRRQLLKRFDADGNGMLDAAEREALRSAREARQARRVGAGGRDRANPPRRPHPKQPRQAPEAAADA